MPGWPASAAPASRPVPVTALSTQAGRERQLADADGCQRRVLGRLDDQRVAHRECGPDDAGEDLQGIVPRDDAGDHAVRLAQSERGVAVEEGDRVAVDLVGRTAVE